MAKGRYKAGGGAAPSVGPTMVRRPDAPSAVRRGGIQVIQRAEQEEAYEPQPAEVPIPPLTVGEAPEPHAAHDSALSNGSIGQLAVNPTQGAACMFCDRTEASDTLIPGFPDGGADYLVCGACVERLVDAMRAELPRRRLRLAMERLAAGTVSIEMVEAVERLVGTHADQSER